MGRPSDRVGRLLHQPQGVENEIPQIVRFTEAIACKLYYRRTYYLPRASCVKLLTNLQARQLTRAPTFALRLTLPRRRSRVRRRRRRRNGASGRARGSPDGRALAAALAVALGHSPATLLRRLGHSLRHCRARASSANTTLLRVGQLLLPHLSISISADPPLRKVLASRAWLFNPLKKREKLPPTPIDGPPRTGSFQRWRSSQSLEPSLGGSPRSSWGCLRRSWCWLRGAF